MSKMATVAFCVVAGLAVTGCGRTTGERALSGGLMGAGGGALLGAATGGNPATGALLGGVGGAAVGAFTR